MSDSLDEKLKSLRLTGNIFASGLRLNKYFELSDEAVELIKQAFADAGYEMELKQPFNKGWQQGYNTAEYVCNHSNHMIGAEWFSRFEHELGIGKVRVSPGIIVRYKDSDVLKAAKRAAGMEQGND